MPEGEAPKAASGEKNIGMAVICYISFLVLIPLLTDAKNDPFVKFHIKQGLVLLIASVLGGAIGSVIPVIGWFLLCPLVSIFCLVCAIMGIVNAVNGKETPLPLIGQFADKFNI